MQFNITVRGKVQGVWYRDSTRTVAIAIGIKGIVKNQTDGSVYIEAVGAKEKLDKLVEWCKTGPELAVVDTVDIVKPDQTTAYTDFKITFK